MGLLAYTASIDDMYTKGGPPPKLLRVVEMMKKRRHVTVRSVDMKNFDREVEHVKVIYNQSWARNWGFVPMTDPEIDRLGEQLKPIIDPDLVTVAEVDGRVVARSRAQGEIDGGVGRELAVEGEAAPGGEGELELGDGPDIEKGPERLVEADEGRAGDNAGLLLRGTKKDEVERGQVLAKPGSVTPHAEFEGEIYVLTKEEGGRHKPFFKGYKPQFYVRTTDVTGEVELPAGTEMVMPGDTVNLKVKLISPVALEEKTRFAIREGGKTVGAGVVTKIIK